MSWVELSSLQRYTLASEPVDKSLFRNSIFGDVIKLRCGHAEVGWAPTQGPMSLQRAG